MSIRASQDVTLPKVTLCSALCSAATHKERVRRERQRRTKINTGKNPERVQRVETSTLKEAKSQSE